MKGRKPPKTKVPAEELPAQALNRRYAEVMRLREEVSKALSVSKTAAATGRRRSKDLYTLN